MARKMWRTLEPYHGLIYFASEAEAEYAALGIVGRDGYFASRAAALGVVPAEVVIATFFNFSPALVRHAIPAAWASAPPERIVAARLRAVDRHHGDPAVLDPEGDAHGYTAARTPSKPTLGSGSRSKTRRSGFSSVLAREPHRWISMPPICATATRPAGLSTMR